MNKNTAFQKGHLSLFVLFVVVTLFLGALGYFFYKNYSIKIIPQLKEIVETKPVLNTSISDQEIDTTNWVVFPEKGSYTGWTLKTPEQYKPIGVQAEFRVYIESMDDDSVVISFRNNGYSSGTLKESVQSQVASGVCGGSNNITPATINGNKGFKYSGDCMGTMRTAYTIENPYLPGNVLDIKIDVKQNASVQQINLSQKILDTLAFVEPDKPISDGYNVFHDVVLGFSITYPEKYTDERDNATGWPNADLVLYSGGQSYDLVVQVWNLEADYQNEYADNPAAMDQITVRKVKDKYVTFLNGNNSTEMQEIIDTFKLED